MMLNGGKNNKRLLQKLGRIQKEKNDPLPKAPRWSLKSSSGWGCRGLVGPLRATEEPKQTMTDQQFNFDLLQFLQRAPGC